MRALFFELRYLLGRAPWDTGVTPPEVVELVERGDLPRGGPWTWAAGPALTVSTWPATAGRWWGWISPSSPIRRAQQRARRMNLPVRFYRADVTDLGFLTGPFDLALDIGCLHGIPPEGRMRYAAEVGRLVRPGGLYVLYAFLPRPDGPPGRGIAPEEVRRLFCPPFAVERQEGGEDPSGPRSAWYWLRRAEKT